MSYYGTRSRMTRLVLDKLENDNYLNNLDHNEWYKITSLDLLPQANLFLQCNKDDETKLFIENCIEKSDWFLTQIFHSIVLSMLKWFMATTSVNGLLQRGSMFVFSIQQFRALIDFDSKFNAIRLDNLLDLGSGDGAVTSKMASFFNNVYVTEMSTTMQWRLGQKGFKVLGIEEWDQYKPTGHNEILKYDAISVLNLLDRCDKPLTLLKQIKMALKPNGLLIIALVLPFKPYVEYNNDNKPLEDLFNDNNNLTQCDVANFCEFKVKTTQFKSKSDKIIHQINLLIEKVTSLDFDLLKFTKLPYLCEGNLSQSYYFMYDYVFIFKAKNQIIK